MILIAYDGSDDAKAAIEHAGKLFPGEQTTVLNVWHRFIDTMARVGGGLGVIVDYDQIDKDSEKAAGEKADEGVALARETGLDARAQHRDGGDDGRGRDPGRSGDTRGQSRGLRQPRLHGRQVADAGQRLPCSAAAR